MSNTNQKKKTMQNPNQKKKTTVPSKAQLFSKCKNPPKKWFGDLQKKHQPEKLTEAKQSSEVHVLWDFENTPLPPDYDIFSFKTRINDALKNVDANLKFKHIIAAGNLTVFKKNAAENNLATFQQVVKELEYQGVTFFPVPKRTLTCCTCPPGTRPFRPSNELQYMYSRLTDLADAILIREMIRIPLDYPPPGLVLLISGDKDFATSLKFLSQRGYKILLADRDDHPSYSLQKNSDLIWAWMHLRGGAAPCLLPEDED